MNSVTECERDDYDRPHNSRESLVLCGGLSRRMGADKGSILVDGKPLRRRTADLLSEAGWPPTLLGGSPVPAYEYKPDAVDHAGPAEALRAIYPSSEFVFVVSCDIPRFDAAIPDFLAKALGSHEAAVPIIGEHRQPLCAVYRKTCFEKLRSAVHVKRLVDWLEMLDCREVTEAEILGTGLDPRWFQGANTPEQLRQLLGD